MNLEKLSQPINSQSIEEHEKVLSRKMNEIRLEYVDRIFSKKIPLLEEKVLIDKEEKEDLPIDNLLFLLDRYTLILRDLMTCYITQKKNEGVEWKPEMYDPAQSKFIDQIVEFHTKDREHWVEKTMTLLREEVDKAENASQNKNIQNKEVNIIDTDDRHGTAGLINFDVDAGYSYWFKDSDIPSPIKDSDLCISIHLDPLFKKTLSDSNANIFSSKSLEKLAIQIVDKFPETKAIIGESWLMDTAIAERIGFKIYKREKFSGHGSFWSQFINSNGQIDNARVKKFLETGEAPYRIALGAITVEDFLRKYLPKERKGKVILKEENPNFKSFEHDLVLLKEFQKMWDISSAEEVKNFLIRNSLVSYFNESEKGRGFIDLLVEEKDKEIKMEYLEKNEKLREYNKSFQELIKEMKFIDKEVIIE